MIVVTGHLSIAPDQLDTALAAIRTNVAATRAEPGNVDYRFSTDLDEPGRLNVVEQWEDEAALDAHMASAHMAEFMGAIIPMVTGAEVVRHDVSASSKLI